MTDRLRRLDALFAERVLGYTTERFNVIHGGVAEDGLALTGKPGKGDILLPYPRPLPYYTRSLDAFFSATNEGWCCRTLLADHNYVYEAQVSQDKSTSNEPHISYRAHAGHPAEAFVLACLRAVGVPEEELE